jgi:drug/metabolite transporter (DMT)-like permease
MMVLKRAWTAIFKNPYAVLVLAPLFWGGNAVAGRLAVGQISPMMLTALRWVIVLAILLPFAGRATLAAWPELRKRTWFLIAMGVFGFTGFNALFYAAAYHTSGVNLAIFQGSIPVLVLIGTVIFFRSRVRALQILGMVVTLLGVILISVRGDLEVLRTMALNIGDVWMLIACVFYAGYTLGLRNRPSVTGLAFFLALAVIAFITSIPLLLLEAHAGQVQWPTPMGWIVVLYIALFPSLIAQIMYIRGVELIGPGRAGIFVNLVPVFGALLSVIILGEPFAWYHAAGLVFTLGGIWLAEQRR